jgi:NAD(P)-dependent dehydrogenase (short-subunit alcohol dehydrogenase family)
LPYSVTKAAAIHLSKALAVICSPKIRVNSVSPGLLMTEWGMQFPEEKREAARQATKLGRFATVEVSPVFPFPSRSRGGRISCVGVLLLCFSLLTWRQQDVADQVRLLALSKSMTGQNIVVDSGTTL